MLTLSTMSRREARASSRVERICVSLILIDFQSAALTRGMEAENPVFQLLSIPILILLLWPPMLSDMVWSSMVR